MNKELAARAKQRLEEYKRRKFLRVVVKFREELNLPYIDYFGERANLLTKLLPDWTSLSEKFKGSNIVLERLISSVSPTRLRVMASEYHGHKAKPELLNYFSIVCPSDLDTDLLLSVLKSWKSVELAYVERLSVEPPAILPQGHLGSATAMPPGVDASYAHGKGFKGGGVAFSIVEHGWEYAYEYVAETDEYIIHEEEVFHQDFSSVLPIVWGCNYVNFGHGTASLGLVIASDDANNCMGIAPAVQPHCVSLHKKSDPNAPYFALGNCLPNITDAIVAATSQIDPSQHPGVLLIEAQVEVSNNKRAPVEFEPGPFQAILDATNLGVIVIEPAGTSDISLNGIINRGVKDSGAIIVGGMNPQDKKVINSNTGQAIDCFAWGTGVTTTGDGGSGFVQDYTSLFNGTSSASAIVAGIAAVMQSTGRVYSPLELRKMFRRGSANPAGTWMPDLRDLIDNPNP